MVDKKDWDNKMQDFFVNYRNNTNRVVDQSPLTKRIGNYLYHLNRFNLGNSLLDVACGTATIKRLIQDNMPSSQIRIIQTDAYPPSNIPDIIKMNAEELDFANNSFDTVTCFAALDNMYDPDLALKQMMRVANHRVILLTGINIEADRYHTHKITLEMFKPYKTKIHGVFISSNAEDLTPNVILIELIK